MGDQACVAEKTEVTVTSSKGVVKSVEADVAATSVGMPASSRLKSTPSVSECAVCMDAEVDTVFVPCGHMATCSTCAERLGKRPCCPVCRKRVKHMQRVFFA